MDIPKADNFRDIEEIKDVRGVEEVNILLNRGWVLLLPYTRNCGEGLNGDNFPCYLMGRPKS